MRRPECHPERAHQARGLCPQCYMQQYDGSRKGRNRKDKGDYSDQYRRPPVRAARIPECHPDRKHAAHGMCRPCYAKHGPVRATCHPDKRLVANGLCSACYGKRRYEADPETARRLARESGIRTRQRLRDQMVAAYGGRCACVACPERNSAFLTLDHIQGDGKEHRARVGSHSYADLRRKGWPQDGYRLLCWNCNAMTRNGKRCPHNEGETWA